MSKYEIYARNFCKKGHAPWFPHPVDIADVGYMFDGRWIKLFNASEEIKDGDDKSKFPPGYHPITIGDVDQIQLDNSPPETSESVETMEIGAGVSSSEAVSAQAGGMFAFASKSTRSQGAILMVDKVVDIHDALDKANFINYICSNYASWMIFANKVKHRGILLTDLVLVTGFHKSSAWACAAFSSRSSQIKLEFSLALEV
ncbi:hypothetical protein K439DRAFT_1622680 [Ramaria rubella]|nr:hypothetical protein K439DRAFT_1622680 [Ramaria rubella]